MRGGTEQHGVDLLRWEVQVADQCQVVATGRDRLDRDVRDLPGEPGRGRGLLLRSQRLGSLDRDGGVVESERPPSHPSQPERVASLAAGQVDRPADRESFALGADEPVRFEAPDQIAVGVPLIPVLGVHPIRLGARRDDQPGDQRGQLGGGVGRHPAVDGAGLHHGAARCREETEAVGEAGEPRCTGRRRTPRRPP